MDVNIKLIDSLDDKVINFMIEQYIELHNAINNIENLDQKTYNRIYRAMQKIISKDDVGEGDILYGAYLDNKIVGYAYIGSDNYLRDLFVKKEYRNKGIGTLLMNEIVKNVEGNISVTASPMSIDFYKKHDFLEGEVNANNTVEMERISVR
ncbi:MAG: GNAT family N-acetyltransferase [Bacilli bacterium]|nr:GNAT family N-acetyltransferase [Bacilli bacterium]